MKKKRKILNRETMTSVFVSALVLVALAVVALNGTVLRNADSLDSENFGFYDENSCRCVERERLKCQDSWELDLENALCRSGNNVTNVLIGCSVYECSGIVYEFNQDSQVWGQKQ